MQSRWDADDAKAAVDRYGQQGFNEDLALCTYATRLLGGDPRLVLHGGGNSSVKTQWTDLDGTSLDILCVKGSGWDMATIEPPGLPAVLLEPLRKLADLDQLSDDEMVTQQRRFLMDPAAPNPSVEAILHAILPPAHVDHTHANAIVALSNQPDGEAIIRDLFPDALIVPYIMPGFVLAKDCAERLKDVTDPKGMVLLQHGIFTFAEDARTAYEDMISMVDAAEKRLSRGSRSWPGIALPEDLAGVADIAPILRGAIALKEGGEATRRWVLDHRSTPDILDFCNAEGAADLAARGNATPDHVLRIKRTAVALPAPRAGALDAFARAVGEAVDTYARQYREYFEINNKRVGGDKVMLDPMPRVFYVAGVGMFGVGKTGKEAKIAADIAEATVDVIGAAEAVGTFTPLSHEHIFDVEYWSLEQAKLASAVDKPLTGQIAIVTGGAGGLGYATAQALRAEGAELALIDKDTDRVADAADRIGAQAVACDVTDAADVKRAVNEVVARFGGVDILISNAGAAFQGRLTQVADSEFEQAFALNFWSHHYMARACVRVMETTGTGGALVFNVSKQAVNPGADFGPYGTSKAALMALMRQYALECGGAGITANAVNADRIRTGLLTDDFIAQRSKARGVTPDDYMRGNLVRREVTAADVAAAFVHLAKARTSTGAVLTVDGGNVAAMMR